MANTIMHCLSGSFGVSHSNQFVLLFGKLVTGTSKAWLGGFGELAKQSSVDSCFQSVSNGKSLIASAITDKGVSTASDATFQTMAENIASIETGSGIVYKFTENLTIYVTDITPTIDTNTKITEVPTGIYTSRSTVKCLVKQSNAYDVKWSYSYGSGTESYGKWTIIDGQIWVTLGTSHSTGFYPDNRGGYVTIYCESDIICFYD